VQEKRPLKEVLLSNLRVKWQLGGAAIEKLFMPLTYQGSAQTFIDRLVVSAQMRAPRRTELRAEIRPERRPEPRMPFPPEVRPDPAPEVQPQTRPIESKLPTAAPFPSIPGTDIAAPTVEQRIEPKIEPTIEPSIEPKIEPTSVVESPPVLSAAETETAAPLPAEPPAEPPAPPADLKVSVADRIEPPPTPTPTPTPNNQDAPSALMDILSRIRAEADEAPPDRDKPRIP
jgi:hypothetical protein